MKSNFPGFLCTIEGIDGSGKTTLIKNLSKRLHDLNMRFVCTKEPGATILGQKIREFIADRSAPTCLKAEFLLFAADRAQHYYEVVTPHLKGGDLVISDRSYLSSIVYQGFLKGLNLDIITEINEWCMDQKQADLVIYLKIDPAQALERIKTQRGFMTKFEEEYQDHMHIVMQGFETLFKNKTNILIIDALDPEEKITQTALDAILSSINKKLIYDKSIPYNPTQFSSLG